jgi:hypothetical protein
MALFYETQVKGFPWPLTTPQARAELTAEIERLRKDIEALRADISELRAVALTSTQQKGTGVPTTETPAS